MQTLFVLGLATAAAAIVISRPPGLNPKTEPQDDPDPNTPAMKYIKDRMLAEYLLPNYVPFDESSKIVDPRRRLPKPAARPLNQEIERLSRMKQRSPNQYNPYYQIPNDFPFMKRIIERGSYNMHAHARPNFVHRSWSMQNMVAEYPKEQINDKDDQLEDSSTSLFMGPLKNVNMTLFALTPEDDGYFDLTEKDTSSVNQSTPIEPAVAAPDYDDSEDSNEIPSMPDKGQLHDGGGQPGTSSKLEKVPPRQIRQNPNLSRTKSLVDEDLEKLQTGLRQENPDMMGKTQSIYVEEATTPNSTDAVYDVILMSAFGAAIAAAFLGFAFGWYALANRAKAAADVEYPAYGVTGPTIDTSGDRKLAHSAQMYHYQHQKQQIIAMERSGIEERNGSVSDPESEEENEEGDYTVYECPGFATTGDMEVKNPLFTDDPSPATPGTCEVVKPQPKN